MPRSAQIFETPTDATFREEAYLDGNPDVRAAVECRVLRSGYEHFQRHGRTEGRVMRLTDRIAPLRRAKFERLAPLLRLELPHRRRGEVYDFLTEALRTESGLDDAPYAASSNDYDGFALSLIEQESDGLVLDCGAGSRKVYFESVVNFEITPYPSTDVLGVGEVLPFKDAAFDGVLSLSVLEHVKDPFRCASEIVRVLKPGGRLICAVPFLQPEHGYPHHYYNMAPQGLRALFADRLAIDDHRVLPSTHPVWTISWVVRSWAQSLPEAIRERFLQLKLGDMLAPPAELLAQPWAAGLPNAAQFELASATVLFAHKAAPATAADPA